MKKKKIYEQPETAVTRVELESPICSGSSNIEVTSPGASTTSQQINTTFETDNNFNPEGETVKWD